MSKKQLKKLSMSNKVHAILSRVKNSGTKNEIKLYDLYVQKG